MAEFINANKWLKGLVGAVLGGVANGILTLIVDPHVFHDWGKLGTFVLASSLVSAALYIKQSPLWKPDEE